MGPEMYFPELRAEVQRLIDDDRPPAESLQMADELIRRLITLHDDAEDRLRASTELLFVVGQRRGGYAIQINQQEKQL